MSRRSMHWSSFGQGSPVTQAAEQALAHPTCAFNPVGVSVATCRILSRIPAKRGACEACSCTSPYRHGAEAVKPRDVFGNLDKALPPFRERISAAYVPKAAPVVVSNTNKKRGKNEAAAINAIITEVNLANRPAMGMSKAVMQLKKFSCSRAKIAELLNISQEEAQHYRNLDYLTKSVQELVEQDKLSVSTASMLSLARPERQLEGARKVMNGELTAVALDAYVHEPGIRDRTRTHTVFRQ